MRRFAVPLLVALTAASLWTGVVTRSSPSSAGLAPGGVPVPEFPTADPQLWINSPPLRMADLRGQVVLLDVWTFG